MLQKPDPGISATPHENNLRYFNVVIAGPQDSAYDGSSTVCLIFPSSPLRVSACCLGHAPFWSGRECLHNNGKGGAGDSSRAGAVVNGNWDRLLS